MLRLWNAAANGRRTLVGALVIAASLSTPGLAAGQETDALILGKAIYAEASCVGCHKWHGGGGGGYGGAALSLRTTALNHELLAETVRCGRPGTGMPYHDRTAYRDDDPCWGLTKADIGANMPPKGRKNLSPEEIEAVVGYVEAAIKGRGAPTKQDCIAYWGDTARECKAMK